MQDIIILILFTYPGAMADYFHSRWTKGKEYADKTEEYFRIARDFFISALITVASVTVYCAVSGTAFSLGAVAGKLGELSELIAYLPISLVLSWMTAFLWKISDRVLFRLRNKRLKKEGKPELGEISHVWQSLLTDPEIPTTNSVFAVYDRNGKLIRAGAVHEATTEPEADPWVTLKFMEWAEEELELPYEERELIGSPYVSCVNINNGMYIDVHDGDKLYKAVDEYKETISS